MSLLFNLIQHSCFHCAGLDTNAVTPIDSEGDVRDKHPSHESKVQSKAAQCSNYIGNGSSAMMHNGAHCISDNPESGEHERTGGALWDIFRREDADKLQDYHKKHTLEFRHLHCNPVKQVLFSLHSWGVYFPCFSYADQ